MATTHLPNIAITVTLQNAPAESAGFGTILGIFPLATNDLDGETVVTYTTAAEAAADVTAGHLSSTAYDAVTAVFAQTPKPASVKIANVDLVGAESYATALARIMAVDDDFYGVFIGERSNTAILAIAAAVESTRKICAVQSDEAGFLTATYPAALTALATRGRTLVHYHSDDTEYQDAAHLAAWLAYDPDTRSAPADLPVAGVALPTGVSAAERLYCIGHNVNLACPYAGAPVFVDPGRTGDGRPAYERLTADWLNTRLEEDLSALKVAFSSRGAKFPLDEVGLQTGRATIEARLALGVQAQHFVAGGTESAGVAITSGDTSAQRLRFTARAQLLGSARILEVTADLTRDALT